MVFGCWSTDHSSILVFVAGRRSSTLYSFTYFISINTYTHVSFLKMHLSKVLSIKKKIPRYCIPNDHLIDKRKVRSENRNPGFLANMKAKGRTRVFWTPSLLFYSDSIKPPKS